MAVSYKNKSKIYGLLDRIYFKNKCNSPRYILANKIENSDYKILEIAVGTAENCIILARNKPKLNIIGIDMSEQMLNIAKNNIKNENISNIELLKMNGLNMSFIKETFDYIIISLLLHEIPEEISDKILSGCRKILKNNGKIYILEWEYPKKIIQKIVFLTIKLFEPKEFKLFMEKDLNKYFNKNGFQIRDVEYGDYSKVIELVKCATST